MVNWETETPVSLHLKGANTPGFPISHSPKIELVAIFGIWEMGNGKTGVHCPTMQHCFDFDLGKLGNESPVCLHL